MYLVEGGKCVQSFREGVLGQLQIVKPKLDKEDDNSNDNQDDNNESPNVETDNIQTSDVSDKQTSWTITFTSQ